MSQNIEKNIFKTYPDKKAAWAAIVNIMRSLEMLLFEQDVGQDREERIWSHSSDFLKG